jgi:hypothetical protein
MDLLQKRLALFGRRSGEWTGILQRIFREFADAAEAKLSDEELDRFLSMPDRLVDLGQSGVLLAIELQAGRDGVSVALDPDPNAAEDLKLNMLPLCDLAADRIELRLIVTDQGLAVALGADAFPRASSPHLHIEIHQVEVPAMQSTSMTTAERGGSKRRVSS